MDDDEEDIAIERPKKQVTGESPTRVRLHGLLLIVIGAVLTPVFFILAYILGLILASIFRDGGSAKISAGLVAIPLVNKIYAHLSNRRTLGGGLPGWVGVGCPGFGIGGSPGGGFTGSVGGGPGCGVGRSGLISGGNTG
jgi:hypothetical protein